MSQAGGPQEWERLTAADNDIDAQLLVGVLEEAGIEATTVKDRSGYGDYLLGGSNQWAPVGVHVHSSDLDAARGVLEGLGSAKSEGDGEAVRPLRWFTVVAIVVVTMIVVLYVMEQRDLII